MASIMPRRLILVVAAFFPDSYGGAERQALILAEALGRAGYEVTIVAPTTDKLVPREERTAFGVIIRKFVSAYPNLGGKNILSFISWTMWFRSFFSRSKWKGVPIYVFHARLHAFGPALTAIRNSAPLLIKLGGGGEASEFQALRSKKYLYGHFVEWVLRKNVDTFVANSKQIATELGRLGISAGNIAEFPNGVVLPTESAWIESMRKRQGRRFIYAGRLVPDKSVDVLYHAAIGLAEEGLALNLRLIGTGSEKERLEKLPSTTKHRNAVTFPGFVSDVYPELEVADFFVSASKREGQSNALLEAMSSGLIPIVYAASGVEEVVSDGVNGFVVRNSTVESFQETMRKALEMDDETRRRMSLASRQFIEANIGIDAVAQRTIREIETITVGA